MAGIVDGHAPIDLVAIPWGLRAAAGQAQAGEGVLRSRDAIGVRSPDAEVILLDLDRSRVALQHGHCIAIAGQLCGVLIALPNTGLGSKEPVEEPDVGGVLAAFESLQIVAVGVVLGHDAVLGRGGQHLVVGQQGRLSRTQIGKDDSAHLLAGIGAVPNELVEVAAGGLRGVPWHLPVTS